MPDAGTDESGDTIQISDSAAKRVRELVESEGNASLMLRIAISGGGCSGFQYGFELDEKQNDDDLIFEHGGIRVAVDPMSLEMVKGSELDYVEDLMGSFFSLKNPNAASTCGCGNSFAV